MKHFWKILSVALAIVILLLTKCKGGGGTIVKSDTVTVRDTIKYSVSTDVYVPQPYKVEVDRPVPVYVEGKEVIREVDTANILKDYFSTVHYSDSVSVDHGTVIINDQISQNRIKQRQVTANLQREVITNTIKNTVQEKKKNSVWVGLTAQGGNVPFAVGGSVMFLQKKGWGVDGALLKQFEGRNKLIYQATFKKQLWK